jgi:hypothetical protein
MNTYPLVVFTQIAVIRIKVLLWTVRIALLPIASTFVPSKLLVGDEGKNVSTLHLFQMRLPRLFWICCDNG